MLLAACAEGEGPLLLNGSLNVRVEVRTSATSYLDLVASRNRVSRTEVSMPEQNHVRSFHSHCLKDARVSNRN